MKLLVPHETVSCVVTMFQSCCRSACVWNEPCITSAINIAVIHKNISYRSAAGKAEPAGGAGGEWPRIGHDAAG